METDRDWLDLARDWQAEDGPAEAPDIPADIRRRVQRFSWGLYAWTVFEVVVLGFILAFVATRAWQRPDPVEVTTAVGVWLIVIAGMSFTLWNRRGTWRPAASTTRAFVELSHKRCVRQLRGIRFAWGLLAVEVALFIPWIWWVVEARPEKQARVPEVYWTSYGLLAGLVSFTVATLLVYGGIVRRQLAATQSALDETDPEEQSAGSSIA